MDLELLEIENCRIMLKDVFVRPTNVADAKMRSITHCMQGNQIEYIHTFFFVNTYTYTDKTSTTEGAFFSSRNGAVGGE